MTSAAKDVRPELGSEWVWEIGNPSARCRVRVERLDMHFGSHWVYARILTTDPANIAPVGNLWGNELDRWHEAVTPAPRDYFSWETRNDQSADLTVVPWRVGRRKGRNMYAVTGDDWEAHPQIGCLDTPELAGEACRAHNEALNRGSYDEEG